VYVNSYSHITLIVILSTQEYKAWRNDILLCNVEDYGIAWLICGSSLQWQCEVAEYDYAFGDPKYRSASVIYSNSVVPAHFQDQSETNSLTSHTTCSFWILFKFYLVLRLGFAVTKIEILPLWRSVLGFPATNFSSLVRQMWA